MSDVLSGTRFASMAGANEKRKTFFQDHDGVKPNRRVKTSRLGLKVIWILCGLLAISVPILIRNIKKNNYQNRTWENIARRYNEWQAERGSNNKYVDLNECHWWKFGCQPYYVDEQGNYVSEYDMKMEQFRQKYGDQQQGNNGYNYNRYYGNRRSLQQQYYGQADEDGQPAWYNQWGSTEEQRKQAMEAGEPTRGLRFVYVWQMIMFIFIMIYGFKVIHEFTSPAMLVGVLLIWFQFNFLSLFMLSEGCIQLDENDWDLSGFYGQYGVLIFMTNAAYALFGAIFTFFFICTATPPREQADYNEGVTNSDENCRLPVSPPEIAQTVSPTKPIRMDAPASQRRDADEDDYVRVD